MKAKNKIKTIEPWEQILDESITTVEELSDLFEIDKSLIRKVISSYPMLINRYYLGLIKNQGDWINPVDNLNIGKDQIVFKIFIIGKKLSCSFIVQYGFSNLPQLIMGITNVIINFPALQSGIEGLLIFLYSFPVFSFKI